MWRGLLIDAPSSSGLAEMLGQRRRDMDKLDSRQRNCLLVAVVGPDDDFPGIKPQDCPDVDRLLVGGFNGPCLFGAKYSGISMARYFSGAENSRLDTDRRSS